VCLRPASTEAAWLSCHLASLADTHSSPRPTRSSTPSTTRSTTTACATVCTAPHRVWAAAGGSVSSRSAARHKYELVACCDNSRGSPALKTDI
jgi:hypothetical protein